MTEATTVKKRKKSDRSNPPFYLVVGTRKADSVQQIVTQRPTIGRAKRFVYEMTNFLKDTYSEFVVLRCKSISEWA